MTEKDDKKVPKKKGRPILFDEVMEPVAIKLPSYMVDWINRTSMTPSKYLRLVLGKAEKFDGVLPADPGPGETVRSSYSIPTGGLKIAEKFGRGKGYTIGLRRIIRADMAGMLNGLME